MPLILGQKATHSRSTKQPWPKGHAFAFNLTFTERLWRTTFNLQPSTFNLQPFNIDNE
ncbi:hypothetical protein BJP36_41880 [Moorena producens JHB]|uniref:Uncharacterized protein n=1 Tax=Moorena producens (strain JHB) TaxID=1454205 RepID=A0A9Q9SSN5_MOOP1|nr:hypothetical protein [Moorena producens]WAN68917.1 hypothetical protein BJP36_41880 [Moorena producens JHB]